MIKQRQDITESNCLKAVMGKVTVYHIDDMQFGFMKGKGTTNAIFIARQMQEKFRAKGKKLYFRFVDLEKA